VARFEPGSKRGRRELLPPSTIHVPAISDGNHLDCSGRIVHDVQNAIVAGAETIFLATTEFLAALRTWILLQVEYLPGNGTKSNPRKRRHLSLG
jgi:hypothetical protein